MSPRLPYIYGQVLQAFGRLLTDTGDLDHYFSLKRLQEVTEQLLHSEWYGLVIGPEIERLSWEEDNPTWSTTIGLIHRQIGQLELASRTDSPTLACTTLLQIAAYCYRACRSVPSPSTLAPQRSFSHHHDLHGILLTHRHRILSQTTGAQYRIHIQNFLTALHDSYYNRRIGQFDQLIQDDLALNPQPFISYTEVLSHLELCIHRITQALYEQHYVTAQYWIRHLGILCHRALRDLPNTQDPTP